MIGRLILALVCLLFGSVGFTAETPPIAPPAMDTPAGPSTAPLTAPGPIATPRNDLTTPGSAAGADKSGAGSGLVISLNTGTGKGGTSAAVQLFLLFTALAVAPAFIMMMTCFTRVIIVLGFVRRALGTQTLPPNQVMLGLALFLSLFIMAPTIKRVNEQALQPYLAEQVTQEVALDRAKDAVKDFMLKQTRKSDLALFIRLSGEQRPRTAADVSFLTLVPAFATSELKTAFQMGFIIFLPFLVIDLVVSAVLMSLGMMMLPPIVISMPFKILLFVLVDGWTLLMQGLVASYR